MILTCNLQTCHLHHFCLLPFAFYLLPCYLPPAMTPIAPPVSIALTDMGIPHRVFRHAGLIHSLEQAAAERGQIPEQVVRSLLFRIAAGNYIMVLAAGPAQVSWKALRQHVGQTRLTTAHRDEVRRVTGYEIGAVAPFGLPAPIPVIVERGVLAQSEISIGSGVRGTTVILRTEDLMRALGSVDVASLIEE
jgi:Cys-tRNA(Pro)/Cys-tRNA(Cys) deacylase